jgi:hypothetical protein
MNRVVCIPVLASTMLLAVSVVATMADDLSIHWSTIDGGGEMWSGGGDFDLGGTIGQSDATVVAMSGGGFTLVGGFWAGMSSGPELTPGDMNCDALVTAADIDGFVIALTGGQAVYEAQFPNCQYLNADCNDDGLVSAADIDTFVAILTGG